MNKEIPDSNGDDQWGLSGTKEYDDLRFYRNQIKIGVALIAKVAMWLMMSAQILKEIEIRTNRAVLLLIKVFTEKETTTS